MLETTLKEARESAGFTQQQMADELGISRPTYSQIEANPGKATVLQARRICTLLS
ncbi:helix-turn-helix transcriptional regulator, partial [Berryella intestinalis]|uniref:helix-turn-helix transcriptional regulator n=1 Tax=Berryella intestinalis TaxID=1531429 RepID=UPI0039BF9E83